MFDHIIQYLTVKRDDGIYARTLTSVSLTGPKLKKTTVYILTFRYFQDESQSGAIYISIAQYEHSGRYECVAKTTQDEVIASATLRVEGK